MEVAADNMAFLEKVAVGEGTVHAQLGGVGAVAVVEFEGAVKWQLVLDGQVDIDAARFHAGAEFGRHAAVGEAVDRDDFLGELVEVGRCAFGDRGHGLADFAGQEPACAFHAKSCDGAL